MDRIEAQERKQSSGKRSGATVDVWVIEAVPEPSDPYWRVNAQPGRMETSYRDSNMTGDVARWRGIGVVNEALERMG